MLSEYDCNIRRTKGGSVKFANVKAELVKLKKSGKSNEIKLSRVSKLTVEQTQNISG